MAGSSVIVALNAVALKRLRLPEEPGAGRQPPPAAGAPTDHPERLPATEAA